MLSPELGPRDATYSARFPTVKTIRANDGYLFTAPVGRFRPNAFGLYDMHGNAVQWCADWYARGYYAVAPIDDPAGPESGSGRIQRGSSWNGRSTCLASYRMSNFPNVCDNNVGFRVALVLPQASPPAAATFTNSIAMKFALIPAGEFQMGETRTVEEELKEFEPLYNTFPTADLRDEYPRHRVRITHPFYMAVYHVTRGQFRQFVDATGYRTDAEKNGKGGYGFQGGAMVQATKYTWRETDFPQTDEHPVVNVSWNDAVSFCDWLSRKENKKYRLPTEAEWEYACRGHTSTRYWCGDDPESLAEAANAGDAAYLAKFPGVPAIRASDGFAFTAPVGNFRPNSWGLYDMVGNAWQWCWDWYGSDYFAASPVDDPAGPDSGLNRVFRGGAWSSSPHALRSSARNDQLPAFAAAFLGFRVARTP